MILGIPSRPGLRVMVASKPVDFRKGMDGLAAMVTQALASDPFAGDVFVFRAKRTDRIKLLLWDGSVNIGSEKGVTVGSDLTGVIPPKAISWRSFVPPPYFR